MTTLEQVQAHYKQWTEDMKIRKSRKNGWDDITRAYLNQLPDDWPYLNKVVDPRIRTVVIEKNARLLNSKLQGRLVHREGGDVIKAQINNALLDFQWDSAKYGGTMLEKWSGMDEDTRLYASRFAEVWWRHKEEDGKVVFDGNEFTPLSIFDCGIDPSCNNIRDARWFQKRSFEKVDDLREAAKGSKGLKDLLQAYDKDEGMGQDRRDSAYTQVALQRKGLQDRVGMDKAYPVIEMVKEYRPDKVIYFSPKHNILVSETKNPYIHGKIPIVQLKYRTITGDPLGESDIESVLPLWKSIQATVNGYLDSMITHIRPPLKVVENSARVETLIYAPEAKWLMNSPESVQELQSSGEALRYFQTAYTSFVSAFNTALGEFSQGTSNIDPTASEKTATEIKASGQQQNSRDEKDQTAISECIQDMMSMWVVNNRQFLFADPNKQEYLLRILGKTAFDAFKQSGLDQMVLTDEVASVIHDVVQQTGGNLSDEDLSNMIEAGKTPLHPVKVKRKKVKGENMDVYKPKMSINSQGTEAEISIVPEDLEGVYDYIPAIKSMAVGAFQDRINSNQKLFSEIFNNQQVTQLLMSQGYQLNAKEMISAMFEDLGNNDVERFFSQIPQQQNAILGPNGQPQAAGPTQPGAPQGITAQGPVQQPQLPVSAAPVPQGAGIPIPA